MLSFVSKKNKIKPCIYEEYNDEDISYIIHTPRHYVTEKNKNTRIRILCEYLYNKLYCK